MWRFVRSHRPSCVRSFSLYISSLVFVCYFLLFIHTLLLLLQSVTHCTPVTIPGLSSIHVTVCPSCPSVLTTVWRSRSLLWTSPSKHPRTGCPLLPTSASEGTPWCYCLSLSIRSLELFFATNQGAWGTDPLNTKSPRLCRKFSSPPPLVIPSRTSSPVHNRKLSLGAKAGALDLSTTPCSSTANSPTSIHSPCLSSPPPNSTRSPSALTSPPPFPSLPQASGLSSPPHSNTKAPLDFNFGPSSSELTPSTGEVSGELPRIDAICGKLKRSIRRGEYYL